MSRRIRIHGVWRNSKYWRDAFHAQVTEEAKSMTRADFMEREMVMFKKVVYITNLMMAFHVPKSKVVGVIEDILKMRLFSDDFEPLVKELIPTVNASPLPD